MGDLTKPRSYTVRRMKPDEVDAAYRLVEKDRNYFINRKKYSLFFKYFPEAFYVAVNDNDGSIVGAATFVQIIDGIFNIGYVTAGSESRFNSIEKLLVNDAPDMFLYTALLVTAEPGTDPFYINLGYDICEAQEDHLVINLLVDRDELDNRISALPETTADVSTRTYTASDLESLIEYDNRARGLDNSRYTTAMVQCNPVVLAVDGKDSILGYAGAYEAIDKIVMDGLYADSDDVALRLFRSILDEFPDSNHVQLQTAESRTYLSSFGKILSSREARKYEFEGQIPPDKTDKVYCVTDTNFTW